MTKSVISISTDPDIAEKLKKKGIRPTDLFNDAALKALEDEAANSEDKNKLRGICYWCRKPVDTDSMASSLFWGWAQHKTCWLSTNPKKVWQEHDRLSNQAIDEKIKKGGT